MVNIIIVFNHENKEDEQESFLWSIFFLMDLDYLISKLIMMAQKMTRIVS